MKKVLSFLLVYFFSSAVFALEDCIVISNEKLSDIRIEDHSVIDVFPIVTIMNEKKILVVHPLKTGSTRFSVLRSGKNISLFNVNVKEDSTLVEGDVIFEIQELDCPPNYYEFDLDLPPLGKE